MSGGDLQQRTMAAYASHCPILLGQEPLKSNMSQVLSGMRALGVDDKMAKQIMASGENPEEQMRMLTIEFKDNEQMAFLWTQFRYMNLLGIRYTSALLQQPKGTTSADSMRVRKELATAMVGLGATKPNTDRVLVEFTEAVTRELGKSGR